MQARLRARTCSKSREATMHRAIGRHPWGSARADTKTERICGRRRDYSGAMPPPGGADLSRSEIDAVTADVRAISHNGNH